MSVLHWEVREDPDDLPIICTSLRKAEQVARRLAAKGRYAMVYEVDERGERFIGEA